MIVDVVVRTGPADRTFIRNQDHVEVAVADEVVVRLTQLDRDHVRLELWPGDGPRPRRERSRFGTLLAGEGGDPT